MESLGDKVIVEVWSPLGGTQPSPKNGITGGHGHHQGMESLGGGGTQPSLRMELLGNSHHRGIESLGDKVICRDMKLLGGTGLT